MNEILMNPLKKGWGRRGRQPPHRTFYTCPISIKALLGEIYPYQTKGGTEGMLCSPTPFRMLRGSQAPASLSSQTEFHWVLLKCCVFSHTWTFAHAVPLPGIPLSSCSSFTCSQLTHHFFQEVWARCLSVCPHGPLWFCYSSPLKTGVCW